MSATDECLAIDGADLLAGEYALLASGKLCGSLNCCPGCRLVPLAEQASRALKILVEDVPVFRPQVKELV